jgi:hypothetical protein
VAGFVLLAGFVLGLFLFCLEQFEYLGPDDDVFEAFEVEVELYFL